MGARKYRSGRNFCCNALGMNRLCILSIKNFFKNLRGTSLRIRRHKIIGPPKIRKSANKTTETFFEKTRNTRFRRAKEAIVVILSRRYGFLLASEKYFDTELRIGIEVDMASITACTVGRGAFPIASGPAL